jgi:hypothetical protein
LLRAMCVSVAGNNKGNCNNNVVKQPLQQLKQNATPMTSCR